jgi:hypothetical protein
MFTNLSGQQQVEGDDAITTRVGAVDLPLGIFGFAVAEYFHHARQDPMDNPAIFMDYEYVIPPMLLGPPAKSQLRGALNSAYVRSNPPRVAQAKEEKCVPQPHPR